MTHRAIARMKRYNILMRYPLRFLLVFAVATASAQTSLESFQREAEKVLGRPISINESNELVGAALGQTHCDQNPLLIKIRSGLDAKLRQQVLAHELGHALLCGRGIVSVVTNPIQSTDAAFSIVRGVSAAIGSCYIDPLADAEAEKRGFNPAQLLDELLRKSTSHSKEEFQKFLKEYFGADSVALAIYCADLRPHSFQISKMEAPVSDEPTVMMRLLALRRDLGKPKCFDSSSCFVLTKRLRDVLSLQTLVIVQNPTTGVFE